MIMRVSDHALVRFLDNAGGIDVELLRARLEASLERAGAVADRIGVGDYVIHADGLNYHVRDGTVVTVMVPPRGKRR